MNLLAAVENMTFEMYERLKFAAETGKWPEGVEVEQAQRESALQLSMAYQARHLNSDDNMTIGPDGEIVHKSKSELKKQFKQASVDSLNDNTNNNAEDIARFTNL
ncbi:YeaC family protein [Thalassomonas sp. M1454]|uniref:YeaC family protein n=1 Tax=Thalassomonas sp. M1454 TaxID=2594477 RepID=UPI001181371F|nr:DUF1315 family protein [Thalassomonas sp. M1454]TRX56849.1 DUF1315 family protein [Thalassomonas sp. M1454]